MTERPNVALARDGPVATVTLDRPERRNSLSDAMLGELIEVFSELRDDAGTRVVIVTGAPPVFSAGARSAIKSGMSADERRRVFLATRSQFRRLFERVNALLENLEQTTIAMINGHAIGGGFGLTLACDFRWAAAERDGLDTRGRPGRSPRRGLDHALRAAGRPRPREGDHHGGPALHGGRGARDGPRPSRRAGRRAGRRRCASTRSALAAKPFRPLAEVKARINAIARTGIPEVNAMTEGFLERT